MNPLTFAQTLIRVLAVWSAFYGLGHFLRKPLRVKSVFPLLPKELIGIILMIFIAIILSALRVMNRTVVPVVLVALAIPGFVVMLHSFMYRLRQLKVSIYNVVFAILLFLIVIVNLAYSSTPNLGFDDPLITYAVQPDRWLNSSKIYWIEETVFSGFPLTYEIMAVWPASLSTDRIDQLSVLQVFQMSLLLVAIFRGMQILRIKQKHKLPTASIVLLCSLLFYWGTLAKTDMAALLFCTLALISAIRESSDPKSYPQYTSWLLMGLALSTKQSSLMVLIPFLLYKALPFVKFSMRVRLLSLAFLAIPPMSFAVRTMIHTGSPTYPVYTVSSLVKSEWELIPIPSEIQLWNVRDSEIHHESHYSVVKHIAIFLGSMEGILLLIAGGLTVCLIYKRKQLPLLIPVFVFWVIAIIVVWPPWWGVKYITPFIPFTGLLGVYLLQEKDRLASIFIPSTCILSLFIPSFLVTTPAVFPVPGRCRVTASILTGNWNESSGFNYALSTPEGMTHMWLNSALTESSTILSLFEEKRYFCDHKVYVAWRHPFTLKLFLENTIEEECRILDEIGAEYVIFNRSDPLVLGLENRLVLLDHIGTDNILSPWISPYGNFTVYRYNSPFL